jgi:Protein of unknown function (DUF2637)
VTRDRLAYTLIALVAVSAAWMSFSALTGLARMAHIWPPFLLPVAIDAYAVAATRLWLTSSGSTKRWAMLNSFGAIAISIAGNSVYHGYAEAGITHLTWQAAAVVAAVAPLTLWLVVHMHSLLSSGTPKPRRDAATTQILETRKQAKTPARKPTTTGKTAAMKAHAAAELQAGRTLTGGQLAREFGVDDSLGRRVMRELTLSANGNGHAR